MYGLAHARAFLRAPRIGLVELGRVHHRFTNGENPDGVNVLDEDWDTLVILDACRYDVFAEVASLPGETGSTVSLGTTSSEFVERNFAGRAEYDTVYVSGNGWFEWLREDIDAEVYRFVYAGRDAVGGMTVRPETVTDLALDTYEEHPDKRMIVHYMQPHQPYLGETGRTIDHHRPTYMTVYHNDVDDETLLKAYRENLELVLGEVERLFEGMDGKFVVTADHGELLGERPYVVPVADYGHPRGVYVDELTEVPWHVYENGRRDVVDADEPYSERDRPDHDVERHLKDLGYRV